MSAARLSDRDRRALRLGALVLLPALLWVWAVRPYLDALGAARDRLAIEREALARERALLDGEPALAAAYRAADSAYTEAEATLFSSPDDLLASAELATYVARAARDSHVWLREADTRPATHSPAGVRTLQMEVRAESDLEGLGRFLQALERGPRLVRVASVSIQDAAGEGDEAAEGDGARPLTLVATVQGFALAPVAGAAGDAAGGAVLSAGPRAARPPVAPAVAVPTSRRAP
ncbi:MAG TPA: type II secretion system protein GspM [Gemmatimonadaceae bacterium]|nr:type II secretion system protein GspM [Gemmatimonadaceae bacterium]